MTLPGSMRGVALIAAGNPAQLLLLVGAGIMLLVGLLFVLVFARLFNLWMQAFLAGANISLMDLLGMMLRRTPMKQAVRLKIMAVQAGLGITTAQIESALLTGADVERAVLAMIRARDAGQEITWEEVVSEDSSQRLRKKLYDE